LFENYIKETRITDIVQLIVIGGRTDHGVNFFDVPSYSRVMKTRVELNCRAALNLTILTYVENNPILLPKNNFTCFDLREKCIIRFDEILPTRASFLSLSFSHDSRLMFNFIAEERKRKGERQKEREIEGEEKERLLWLTVSSTTWASQLADVVNARASLTRGVRAISASRLKDQKLFLPENDLKRNYFSSTFHAWLISSHLFHVNLLTLIWGFWSKRLHEFVHFSIWDKYSKRNELRKLWICFRSSLFCTLFWKYIFYFKFS